MPRTSEMLTLVSVCSMISSGSGRAYIPSGPCMRSVPPPPAASAPPGELPPPPIPPLPRARPLGLERRMPPSSRLDAASETGFVSASLVLAASYFQVPASEGFLLCASSPETATRLNPKRVRTFRISAPRTRGYSRLRQLYRSSVNAEGGRNVGPGPLEQLSETHPQRRDEAPPQRREPVNRFVARIEQVFDPRLQREGSQGPGAVESRHQVVAGIDALRGKAVEILGLTVGQGDESASERQDEDFN